MKNIAEKLDSALYEKYLDYLKSKKGEKDESFRTQGISVMLLFSGDLEDVVRRGFDVLWTDGDSLANGILLFELIEEIISSPAVVNISAGEVSTPDLSTSTEFINARLDFKKNNPTTELKGVWGLKQAGTKYEFINPNNINAKVYTGKGVIIGIIDSGIDFRHALFRKTDDPTKTRILRIWDQGPITPEAGERGPHFSLLNGKSISGIPSNDNLTYGVEYEQEQLNSELEKNNDYTVIRHRGTDSHGTHVASIAAGNGVSLLNRIEVLPDTSSNEGHLKKHFQMILGVAPEADLVIVKYTHVGTPKYKGTNIETTDDSRLYNAINYIINIAKQQKKAVVINGSFGNPLGPHDGLTPINNFIYQTFANQKGRAYVKGAGNSGLLEFKKNGKGKEHNCHGFFSVEKKSEFLLNLDVYDKSTTGKKDKILTPNVVEIWYPNVTAGVTVELKKPESNDWFGSANINVSVEGDYSSHNFTFIKVTYKLEHKRQSGVRYGKNGGKKTVIRNLIKLTISLNINPGSDINTALMEGKYLLKITNKSDQKIIFHVWCNHSDFVRGVRIGQPNKDNIDNNSTMNEGASSSKVIAVALYDHGLKVINGYSSRGPVVSYSDDAPVAKKPNVAAPGWAIYAARSITSSKPVKPIDSKTFQHMSGTSMSAPHVAGAIALMFQKNPNLDTETILNSFRSLNTQEGGISPKKNVTGIGVLDIYETLKSVKAPGST